MTEQQNDATVWWCPMCGENPRCDEDGCCVSCGATVGEVPDWRHWRALALKETPYFAGHEENMTDDVEYLRAFIGELRQSNKNASAEIAALDEEIIKLSRMIHEWWVSSQLEVGSGEWSKWYADYSARVREHLKKLEFIADRECVRCGKPLEVDVAIDKETGKTVPVPLEVMCGECERRLMKVDGEKLTSTGCHDCVLEYDFDGTDHECRFPNTSVDSNTVREAIWQDAMPINCPMLIEDLTVCGKARKTIEPWKEEDDE